MLLLVYNIGVFTFCGVLLQLISSKLLTYCRLPLAETLSQNNCFYQNWPQNEFSKLGEGSKYMVEVFFV